ncbi:tetratricopeptide repeat protein [Helicobacter cappadocius]|uniref:Tetratricopeptide repeat protein n=1 Tax=Helicobacter cappadocius TaxID=3063998 RepID=A0AA90PZY2_9HELI|nr:MULTISPECIES: tetratricopeptide repeat protein [unclassified Helicobacter]MDO7253655.1 tetratricopeptide repeat protein [Helicobacter sp. faydin-H75]MDP2539583.1 tetratricopeptide repeat protein [Helicobacter sp. faydin-H76]
MAKEKNPDIATQVNSIGDDASNAKPKEIKRNILRANFSKLSKVFKIKGFDGKSLIQVLVKKYKEIKRNKKIFFSLIATIGVLFLIVVISVILLSKNSDENQTEETPIQTPPPKPVEITLPPIPKLDSKISEINNKSLDNLIKKANMLYNGGDKIEALNIFNNVANFSQAIASHNLGVIKLREKDYPGAINSFDNAIASGENVSISALDAMVGSYYLKRPDLYAHYMKLASSHLGDSSHKPFYSYLYALMDYYNGYYFESLSPLLNPNSENYNDQNNRLLAKIFLLFNDDYNAVIHLKEVAKPKDYKSLGLLYARIGEYAKAKNYLYRYLNANPKDIGSILALEMIDLKIGNFSLAASALDSIKDQDLIKKAMDTYPIKVILNRSLFDVGLAQEEFWNRSFEIEEKIPYKILFYYAPFRVFNLEEAIKMIREGGVFSDTKSIQEAKNTLIKGDTISNINKNITKALIELNKNNIRDALKYLQISAKSNPNHAVLHYDIGLIYAQMGDFQKAYIHFLRAYHLNSYDITSGLFAIMAGTFIYQDTSRISHQIAQDFENVPFSSKEEKEFLTSFIGYFTKNINDGMGWIKQAKEKLPIYYALEAAYGIRNKDKNTIISAFSNLKKIYPKDIVSNILYELAHNYDTNLKQVALRLHNLFLSENLDLSSVYYGPAFTRELYVYIGFITGSLEKQERILEQKLISQTDTPNGIMQTMALINIYQHKFEKAYALYNALIEDFKEDDAKTKFLGAVAAIGANHPENAVLLLQLSKMDAPTDFETRYALALLYQETGNFKAASSYFNYISVANFKSEFFDFTIDTNKIKSHQK